MTVADAVRVIARKRGVLPSRVMKVIVCLFVLGCARPIPSEDPFVTTSRLMMATRVDVTLPSNQAEQAQLVFSAFSSVEEAANEWKPGSPLAAVNAKAGAEAVAVPPDLFALTQRGVAIGELTDGTFDITWAALWGLWDFLTPGSVPSDEDITARTALVNFRALELNDAKQTLRLPKPGMKIGLGGIAKGHALDQAVIALRAAGVENFLLSAGGQVQASGDKNGQPWRVGIRDPRSNPEDWFAQIAVRDTSLSTSGDYERFFVENGVRYHHILDPRTGRPTLGLRSVTIICPDGTLADALSTAVMVLGKTKGLELVQRMPEVEAVLVDENGKVFATPGAKLDLLHVPTP